MEYAEQQIKNTIKNYFDNAVIIDDQLDLNSVPQSSPLITPLSDAQLGMFETSITDATGDFSNIEENINEISIENSQIESQPTATFYNFINEGIVTFPHKFDIGGNETQFALLKPVIENAKLLIVDWNLRNLIKDSQQQMGEATIKLLRDFSNCEQGLKCAVVYTQEDCLDVAADLKEVFKVEESDGTIFFQKKENQGSVLFGFVLSKKSVKPANIISEISKVLTKNKIITLHFMDCINRLKQDLNVIINRFSLPFQKVLFAQLLTSEIKPEELPQFLNDTILSNLLNESFRDNRLNILFPAKKNKIKQAINSGKINRENLTEMMKTIVVTDNNKDKIINVLEREDFRKKIQEVLDDKKANIFTGIGTVISSYAESVFQGIKSKKLEKLTNEMLVLIMLLDNFFEEQSSFKDSFKEELYNFTKIFKYIEDDDSSKIDTGTILQSKDNNEEYLICITPFCDTFRPNGIDNTYKFIVGKKFDNIESSEGYKNAYTAVPVIDGKNELNFVRWSFFNVKCLEKKIVESNYKKIATIRREYIQNIINKYIAYQSRAGVNEIFYKESNYVETFSGIFKQAK